MSNEQSINLVDYLKRLLAHYKVFVFSFLCFFCICSVHVFFLPKESVFTSSFYFRDQLLDNSTRKTKYDLQRQLISILKSRQLREFTSELVLKDFPHLNRVDLENSLNQNLLLFKDRDDIFRLVFRSALNETISLEVLHHLFQALNTVIDQKNTLSRKKVVLIIDRPYLVHSYKKTIRVYATIYFYISLLIGLIVASIKIRREI